MSIRTIVLTIILITILSIALIISLYKQTKTPEEVLIIFCAGSLKIPIEEVAKVFESKYGRIEVRIEPSGSVEAVRKVIDLGKRCDVLAVADYTLIPQYMVPNYTKWYIAFASNSIVLAYTNRSKYSNIISSDNWYKVLMKSDVRYGFSNPNKDPCGYRAVMILALASILYNDSNILSKLIINNTNIKMKVINNKIHLYVPSDFKPRNNLIVRDKSIDLVGLLEAGILDYAFEYKSVAIQHKLLYVELPVQINLSDPSYNDFYSKVIVHILCNTTKERAKVGQAIVYGITIPSTVKNYKYAIKFIQLLLSNVGKQIFQKLGQPFLKQIMGYGDIPDELKHYIKEVEA